MFLKRFSIFLLVILCVSSCGARLPGPKTARSSALSYFKSYGSKYGTTPFGHKNVSNVTINTIEEISYQFAFVDAIVEFVDGHAARVLIRMNKRFPLGWKVNSWEMLGYQ